MFGKEQRPLKLAAEDIAEQRAALATAKQPSLDRTFIDRIAALERAVDVILRALEER